MNPDYKLFHPKWHRTRIPIFWWLRRVAYTKFITRELTSVFVAYAALLLLWQLWALARGLDAYTRFVTWLEHPIVSVAHVAMLIAVLFHTITWLNLAPKALVLRAGKKRVPNVVVLLAHYGAWLGASALFVWILTGR